MSKISILISIYNPNIIYLEKAFNSIDNQSFNDYEVVIVNDGWDSNKLTEILEKFNFSYHLINNEKNLGLTKSLNKGIVKCTSKYIARFDADDILDLDRLREQCEFLDKNENVAAVFSCANIIDEDGKVKETISYDFDVSKHLKYKGNCLIHSTLCIRKDILVALNGYDERFLYSQDYDLYLRLIDKYKIEIIPLSLVSFRVYENRNYQKRIFQTLLSYFATLKYLRKNKNKYLFFKRTLIVIWDLYNTIFNKGNLYD